MSYFKMNWVNEFFDNKELIIFDIGAFNFDDSINFKTNFPESLVYSFEPFEYNIENYGEKAKSMGVNVFKLAISDKVGKTKFYNSETFNGTKWTCSGSLLMPSEKSGTEIHPGLIYNTDGIEVETSTIKDFCESNSIDRVDIIHMDVQGAEYYAVKGMGEKIRPKLLFCETCEYETYDGALTQKDLDDLLFSMGYKIKERLIYDTLYILD